MSTSVAVLRLISAARPEDRDQLNRAMRQAYAATRASLEGDLGGEHPPELGDRHNELVGFLDREDPRATLASDTWLLVLSHLPAEMQLLLQAIYEELERGAEAALEYGEQSDGEALSVMQTLAPAESLLVELPYTTLTRSLGPDDHDLRRRTLSVEVEWIESETDDSPTSSPALVRWYDGYESPVAMLTAWCDERVVRWTLEIHDPSPGRSAERVLPREQSTVWETVKSGLAGAIEWANSELGEDYIIQPR